MTQHDDNLIESRLALQFDISQLLLTSQSLEGCGETLLQLIARYMSWPVGNLWLLQRETGRLRCCSQLLGSAPEFQKASREGTFGPGEGLPGRVWSTSQPVVIDDLEDEQNFPRLKAASSSGLRSAFAFPIRGSQSVLGVVEFLTPRPTQLDPALLQMAGSIGAQLGLFIERTWAETELRRSQHILENLTEGVSVTDEEGIIVFTNAAEDVMFGYGRGELIGKPVSVQNAYPPEENARRVEEVIAALKTQGRWAGDWTNRRKDGVVFTTSAEISALQIQGRRYWVCVQRNVTQARRAEKALAESEARKSAILNAALDAIISSDQEGNVTEFNAAAERMFGYRRQDILGKEMSAFIIPAHLRQRHKEGMKHYRETGDGPVLDRRIEMPAIRSDGEEFPIEMAISRIPLPGEPQFTAYLRDITERKFAEAESERMQTTLAQERERLQLAHDAAGIAAFDRDLVEEKIVFSPNYWAMYGLELAPTEPTFGAWLDMLHPEDRTPMRELWANSFRDGATSISSEFRVIWPDGTVHWLQGRARIFYANGRPLRVIGTNLDITVQKDREEMLARQSREREEFAFVASHDLKEPLRKIATFSELLVSSLKSGDEERSSAYLNRITGSIERARQLIDDLLAFSAVDQVEMVRQFVDLNEIVRELADELETSRNLVRSVEIGELPRVAAVETQIRQLFQNLLQNAFKYRSERPLRVSVSSTDAGAFWLLSVTDNGIGIAPQYRKDVFKMFKRLHAREAYDGTGIGLSICQKIVERHGGEIWVEPGVDGGSTFSFTLTKARPSKT